jgi:outer membrane protein assembly complex protein YaeT
MALRVLTALGCVLVASSAPAQVGRDLRGQPIGRIEVRAAPGVDPKRVLELAQLAPGQPLSLPLIQRAIRKLYGSGQFSQVVVRARRFQGQVVVVLELPPRERLRQIEFTGNKSISGDDLRKEFNFVPDQEFTPETVYELRKSVLDTYRVRGFHAARAEVRPIPMPGTGRLMLRVEVQEGERARLRDLRFLGDPRFPTSDLLEKLDIYPGDFLNRQRLRDGVDRLMALYRRRGFYEARIGEPSVDGETGVVTFSVEAGVRTTLRFVGSAGFSRADLLASLKLDDERRIDEGTASVLRQRLERVLQDRGFLRAQVKARLQRLGGKRPRKRLTFELTPGPRVRVLALRFPGAKSLPAGQLREVVLSLVEERLARVAPPSDIHLEQVEGEFGVGRPDSGATVEGHPARPLPPRRIYVERAYRAATEDLVELYKTKGFTQVEVDPPRIVPVPESPNIIVEIPVREGVRTWVRQVTFEVDGKRIFSDGELRAELEVKPGKPYNPNEVEESRARLQKLYERRGHIYARVEDQEKFSERRDAVDLVFQIREGPAVRVGRILLEGNVKTSDRVLLDVLAVAPGDVYNPELVSQSQQNLFDLGIFTTATVEPENRELQESYKNLQVKVRERKRGSVEAGMGFSTGDGPRGFLNLGYANIGGYNLQAQFFLKLNYQLFLFADEASRRRRLEELGGVELLEGQATFSLSYPRILGVPFPMGARLDLVAQRRRQLAFNLDKTAVLTGIDVKLSKKFTVQLQYEFENSNLVPAGAQTLFLEEIDRSPFLTLEQKNELKRITLGTVNLGSIRTVVSLDLRDNAFNPRSGFLLSMTGEYTTTLTASANAFVNYFKTTGTLTGYVPLGDQYLIALQAGGGRIFHLSRTSRTPAYKAFFLGGRGSIRGYPEESIIPEGRVITPTEASNLYLLQLPPTSTGGDIYLLGKAELRFPLAGKLAGALFVDVGNLWLTASSFDLSQLPRMSAGLGLRYPTPVGPLSLDYGVNLTRRFVNAENPDTGRVERAFYEGFGAFHFSIGVF